VNADGTLVRTSSSSGVVALIAKVNLMKNDKLIAIRVPADLAEQIDNMALDEGRSRSGMIRRMLDRYINSYYGGDEHV